MMQVDDLGRVIIVADDPQSIAAAEAAVGMANMRLIRTIAWSEALAEVERQISAATILVETAGVADEVVARVLPTLSDMVGAARTVVSFSAGLLDAVSALLIGGDATLLCDATVADRVAALILARHTDTLDVRDSSEEAARLARINAEVARFTETLNQLAGAAQGADATHDRPPIVGDRRFDFALPSSEPAVTAVELRQAIRARRLRDEVFGVPGLFEDPAWDMLLDLFAADLERRQVSVSSLCIAAAVAPTTALRWINKLIAVGLLERRPDAFDRRRAYIALTARAVAALKDYVAALRRSGLAIA